MIKEAHAMGKVEGLKQAQQMSPGSASSGDNLMYVSRTSLWMGVRTCGMRTPWEGQVPPG